jgi:hypothetical protein
MKRDLAGFCARPHPSLWSDLEGGSRLGAQSRSSLRSRKSPGHGAQLCGQSKGFDQTARTAEPFDPRS